MVPVQALERLFPLRYISRAFLDRYAQAKADRIAQSTIKICGCQRCEGGHGVNATVFDDVLTGVCRTRDFAGHTTIEGRCEPVYIGPCADGASFRHLLGCSITRTAQSAGMGVVSGRHTKIQQDGLAIFQHKNIGRFDILVDDALIVDIFECIH